MVLIPTASTLPFPFPELASTLPMDDVLALGALFDFRQTRIWVQNRMAEYKRHVASLEAIYNSIAPINTLPDELLMEIFGAIPELSWSRAKWMISLGCVSRRWRAALLATPQFWVQALDDLDPDNNFRQNNLLPLFLDRSSPCSLKLDMYCTSRDSGYFGWKTFKGHWWRISDLEVFAESQEDLVKILERISKLKRLERLRLEVDYNDVSTKDIDTWKAKSHPYLGRLEISAAAFCSATAVPSLHTLILEDIFGRDVASLPSLLRGLRRCSALTTLHLQIASRRNSKTTWAGVNVVDLPKLRELRVVGDVTAIHTFLSYITFPTSTGIQLVIHGNEQQRVLPDVLPQSLSILHMSPPIDRLFLQSDLEDEDSEVPFVSVRGYVQGAERLRVGPALRICSADRLLQLLDVFGGCTVAELALDLRRVTADMDGDFWQRFFAALPHLRRLELLSCTIESREIKQAIAKHFLASSSCRDPQRISLAWALRALERDKGDRTQLDGELDDVEHVLNAHAQQGGRLESLELYVTSRDPGSCDPEYDWTEVVDVTQVGLRCTQKWGLNGGYFSRLANTAEVVIVGGQLELRADGEDDEDDEEGLENDEPAEDRHAEEHRDEDEDEEEASSANDTE